MSMRMRTAGVLSAAVLAALSSLAHAMDLFGVQPAALDQPQINLAVFVGANTTAQYGGPALTFDPVTGDLGFGNVFNVTAYLDTGASGILISTPTLQQLTLPVTSTIYSDVGVAGSDNFQVSGNIRLATANYYPRTDLDEFADANQTIPITNPYTPMPAPYSTIRAEVGPYDPTVDIPSFDDLDALLAQFNALDVVGMPAMKGRVMVIDPRHVNDYSDFLNLDIDNLDNLPDVSAHTYLYNPGTPFHPTTFNTDPGIPNATHHIKLSYAILDRFTTLSPAGNPGPTTEHNPFIGKDPVRLMDGIAQPDVPGIKISRSTVVNGVPTTLSSEGNWLLDTGAAASILSRNQASHLGVSYAAGTFNTDHPLLIDQNGDPVPNQFQLTIGGIGGQETLAGFFLDSLLLRTTEGNPANDNDPHHLRFVGAPVLVGDITVKDPVTNQILTLDGIFGMNLLIASANFTQSPEDLYPDITDLATSNFDWITFDETNGILGLSVDPAITVNLDDGSRVFSTTQSVGGIFGSPAASVTINAGVTVDSGNIIVGTMQINGIHIIRPGTTLTGRTSTINTLILAGVPGAWTGRLDLTNNNLIVANGVNVPDQIRQAAAHGNWNGTGGITSSSAQASASGSTRTALAYATGAQFTAATGKTLFDGQNFNPTDTLIMYTLAGDANLDGSVTFADFLKLQNHYNQPGDWIGGDWNYDGTVTFADFLLLQNNYNKTLDSAALFPAGGGPAAAGTPVPEPGALALLACAAAALVSRKRNRPAAHRETRRRA